MIILNRRQFHTFALALASPAVRLLAAPSLSDILRDSMKRRGIPNVVAMVATPDRITYTGAFGKRDVASGIDVKPDSMFAIASMTKAITATAALQLVEQGKVTVHEPVSKHLPELGMLNVLTGFDSKGQPILHPAMKPVTLHHLLTHTSGFAYDTWDESMLKYNALHGGAAGPVVAPLTPLIFEPGTRWQYGTSMDWAGKLVEAVSGLTLEQYFQRNILQPLGMKDTTFIFPAAKVERLVSSSRRQPDGSLKEDRRAVPPAPKAYNGGGGLFSTAPDYVRFMQMILNKGRGPGGQVLQAKTVAMMTANQIGDVSAGKLKTYRPAISSDVDFHPGFTDGFTYGFLINKTAYQGGRSAGSLAWAGVENTFYWIDPRKSLCAVVMMQFFPFVDKQAVGLLGDFEKAVYGA
ncbi:MAG TPA: serine hydrolase domain-containing protein [Bryobacteraceae bacterium]|jgi:CubicO group peptidase (beta-lactamase class C family)|nr:serine hydrolase domain-containing protein [Bryobacteraceae bacterium]